MGETHNNWPYEGSWHSSTSRQKVVQFRTLTLLYRYNTATHNDDSDNNNDYYSLQVLAHKFICLLIVSWSLSLSPLEFTCPLVVAVGAGHRVKLDDMFIFNSQVVVASTQRVSQISVEAR